MYFNKNAYEFIELNYNRGIFDKCVDITFIITMNQSLERHENIKKQLNMCNPSKKVIIVMNKGYKKYDKYDNFGKIIDISYKDLTYTYMYIFHLARKYKNILILEDDFEYTYLIKNNNITNNINNFIIKNNPNIYYLGCTPWLINIPLSINLGDHYKSIYECSTQSFIINFKSREDLMSLYFSKNNNISKNDIDIYTSFYVNNKYFYKDPLIIQRIYETENKSNWDLNDNNKPIKLYKLAIKLFDNYLKLDSNDNNILHQQWDTMYKKLKILNIIIFFIFLILLIYVIKKIKIIIHK